MTGPVSAPVSAVVFDIGGVLLDYDPRHLYRRLIPDSDELEWFLAEVCTSEWNGRLDAGRPFAEACAELCERHPDHGELVRAWERHHDMVAGEVAGTAGVVERLHAAGVPLYVLSNIPAQVFAEKRERFAVLRMFDGAVLSGEEGVLKPSAELFRRLTERFGLDPAMTLFVDDAERNVRGAQAAGLRAVRFVDAATLEADLAADGLDVRP